MMISLTPGETLRRVELHERYGGRRQGGISPSKVSPNVFLFSDPSKGIQHGYLYDGWREDGLYHYTGEGQLGDQLMVQGNRAVRDHAEEGRELHLLDVRSGDAAYVGQLEYVDHYLADAPESGSTRTRSVIVFRLRPRNFEAGPIRSKIDTLGHEVVKEVPVEQHLTETMLIEPNHEPHEAERREQKLVRSYYAHLTGNGHDVCRLQLRPDDEPAPMFCDIYDKTTNTIIEAKGSIARPAFRMAIGQLADYARLLDPAPSRVILVPQQPRPDLLRLAAIENITVIWPRGASFEDTARPISLAGVRA
jgi:hypothetical protein